MKRLLRSILFILFLFIAFSANIIFNILTVSASPAFEDFTDGWTEAGSDTDRLSQTSARSSWDTLERQDDACLYKSFGSGVFTDFEHTFDLNITEIDASGSVNNRVLLRCYEVQNSYGVAYPCANGILLIPIEIGTSSDWYKICLGQRAASSWVVSPLPRLSDSGGEYNFSVGTEYYILLNRTGTNLLCQAFSDSGYTTQVANATIDPCSTVAYEYIQCPAAKSWGVDPLDFSTGYIENLDIRLFTVTFYFTEGGEFRVDCQTITNASSQKHFKGKILEFCALPLNSSYAFQSFNWTGGSSTSNPYDFTVTSDTDVWLYFDLAATPYIFARFTFNFSNPEPNDAILFNGSYSRASATITAYNWTFGDGNSGSGATVTHSYATDNTYTVNLTVTSKDGTDSFLQNITVETKIDAWIRARFRFDPSNPSPSQSIQFDGSQSDSSSTITVYSWSFGDGNSSSIAAPTHSYNDNGTYIVNLTVTSAVGSDSFLQNVTVSLGGSAQEVTYTSAILIVAAIIFIPVLGIIIVYYVRR